MPKIVQLLELPSRCAYTRCLQRSDNRSAADVFSTALQNRSQRSCPTKYRWPRCDWGAYFMHAARYSSKRSNGNGCSMSSANSSAVGCNALIVVSIVVAAVSLTRTVTDARLMQVQQCVVGIYISVILPCQATMACAWCVIKRHILVWDNDIIIVEFSFICHFAIYIETSLWDNCFFFVFIFLFLSLSFVQIDDSNKTQWNRFPQFHSSRAFVRVYFKWLRWQFKVGALSKFVETYGLEQFTRRSIVFMDVGQNVDVLGARQSFADTFDRQCCQTSPSGCIDGVQKSVNIIYNIDQLHIDATKVDRQIEAYDSVKSMLIAQHSSWSVCLSNIPTLSFNLINDSIWSSDCSVW